MITEEEREMLSWLKGALPPGEKPVPRHPLLGNPRLAVTLADASRMTGLSRALLERHIKVGRLPAIRSARLPGATVVIRVEDLDRWLRELATEEGSSDYSPYSIRELELMLVPGEEHAAEARNEPILAEIRWRKGRRR